MNEARINLAMLNVLDENSKYTQKDFDEEFNISTIKLNNPDDIKINLDFSNKSINPDPEYATAGSSGFDLRADLLNSVIIKPGMVAIIPTGLYFNIPDNFEIQIRPRSGLAAKNNVTVLNTPGTIDADYRGEIKIILINLGQKDFEVNNSDRIAQAVVASVTSKNFIKLNKVNNVSVDTERGTGGFGSTGLG